MKSQRSKSRRPSYATKRARRWAEQNHYRPDDVSMPPTLSRLGAFKVVRDVVKNELGEALWDHPAIAEIRRRATPQDVCRFLSASLITGGEGKRIANERGHELPRLIDTVEQTIEQFEPTLQSICYRTGIFGTAPNRPGNRLVGLVPDIATLEQLKTERVALLPICGIRMRPVERTAFVPLFTTTNQEVAIHLETQLRDVVQADGVDMNFGRARIVPIQMGPK